eukprot:364699-Chlamydomonas_euryale.AAC.14
MPRTSSISSDEREREMNQCGRSSDLRPTATLRVAGPRAGTCATVRQQVINGHFDGGTGNRGCRVRSHQLLSSSLFSLFSNQNQNQPPCVRQSPSTSARPDARSATPAGSSTAWSTASSQTAR